MEGAFLAVGIGCGMAIGFVSGKSAGKKEAITQLEREIRDFIMRRGVTMQAESGDVSLDDFLRATVRAG